MNEFELIARLTRSLPANPSVVAGAGDDCAVLDCGRPGRYLLFKTDAVVEGVHFTAEATPEQIGHKALGRCSERHRGHGGTARSPRWSPPPCRRISILRLSNAFTPASTRLARRHAVAIAGGETDRNPERLLLSVSMLGEVDRDKCVLPRRRQGRRCAVRDRRIGRLAGGQTPGFRAAPGRGAMAGRIISPFTP